MYLPAPHRSSNSWLSSFTTGTQYYILHMSQRPEFKGYVCSLTQSVGCFFSWRSQRLQFDVSSPNGILLFRETSKMITTYGTNSPIIIQFSYFNQLLLWYVVALLHLKNFNWIIIVIVLSFFISRQSDPDSGWGAKRSNVCTETEGNLHLFLHAQSRIKWQLCQFRRLPSVRWRRLGQRSADLY